MGPRGIDHNAVTSHRTPKLLSEELADEATLVFVVDASEEFCAKGLNSFRAIEWQFVIDLSATKVTRLTAGDDGFDLRLEVDFRRSGICRGNGCGRSAD